MQFYSLGNPEFRTSFKQAVIAGIAPDRSLFFPEYIPAFPKGFFETISEKDTIEIAFEGIKDFVGDEIPKEILQTILEQVLDFDFPLVPIEENVSTLELFHGPTMAFKDVGARFMANCLGYFSEGENQEVTVLVATSGDTGGAVANGFLGVEGVKVVILYPSGKVSHIQEKQLTTLGQNITALEVAGTFDDCQHMVKTAFLDAEITQKRKLTSANSINIARWLPQMFYYLNACQKFQGNLEDIVFSIPSGNFGNICAGMVAQRMGMPVKHFIAATNVNDVVPRFMKSNNYDPKPSIATISNAMDVGDPSNFVRIQKLYQNDFEQLSANLSSYTFTDEATRKAMKHLHEQGNYIADPHGAVGYLGIQSYREKHAEKHGIFLETAHPVKFLDVVQDTLGIAPEVPKQIADILHKPKHAISISNYEGLKAFLMEN
ncbi:MAG: threonine synthase [Bacteroidota bacterium]